MKCNYIFQYSISVSIENYVCLNWTYFLTSCRSLTKISLVKRFISHCIVSKSVAVRLTFLEFTNSNRNGRPLPSIRTSTSSRPEELNLATVGIGCRLLIGSQYQNNLIFYIEQCQENNKESDIIVGDNL